MYVIFIHVSGIALLEILFYFYYIGPIESELLKSSMRHIAVNQVDQYNVHYNITAIDNTEFAEKLKQEDQVAKKDREESNYDLYLKAIDYWCILLTITVFVTILQFYFRYIKNKNKKIVRVDSGHGLQLMPIRLRLDSRGSDDLDLNIIDNDDSDDSNNTNVIRANLNQNIEQSYSNEDAEPPRQSLFDINNNDYIILKKKLTIKRALKKIFYYILFISLVLAFEYCFFQYIVLNYEPLSDNELQYIIYKELIKDVSNK